MKKKYTKTAQGEHPIYYPLRISILLFLSFYSFSLFPNLPSQEKNQREKEKIRITGLVLDEDRESLPGASILLAGHKSIGTASDVDGRFVLELNIEKEAELKVSYIGMETATVIVTANKLHYEIILRPSETELQDVVVTGIFNKAKESYTGAATSITQKELSVAGNRNLLTTIRNIDPSFNIMQDITIGSDPNALPSITVRGSSSLPANVKDLQEDSKKLRKANQPLIIMDGFEVSLERLSDADENQIESITLLKDGSATSLYGSRGANGVIVITSKKPEPGRLRITYKGSLSIEAPDLTSYNLMNSREKLAYEKSAGLYFSENASTEKELLDLYNDRKINVERGVDTHWIKYPVRTGIGQKHSIRLEGGDAVVRYSLALSNNNVEGVMKGSGRNTLNGSTFLSYRYKNFVFQNDLQIVSNKANHSPYGDFSSFAKINAYWSPYDDEGELVKVMENIDYSSIHKKSLIYNPLYNALLPQRNESKYKEVINNFAVEWKVFPELIFRGRLSVNSQNSRSDKYVSSKDTRYENYSEKDYHRKGSYKYGTKETSSFDTQLNYLS